MSGIVGLVQFDGSPVESGLFRKLTEFLAFRGPDDQQIWIKDNVGLGHTLFKTTEESDRDFQPLTLDGKTWIVADARIDAREELFAAFKAAGEPDIAQSSWTDAELILRAYRVWGVDCVEHLLGDFAFGIWDDSRQQLFCARDHMGVKPFYYAQVGSCVIFSNTLDCIRQHPLVSDKLNDLAIADFLLFEFNQNSATTSFADIQRLPPAHGATWSGKTLNVRRYWSMPIDEPTFYKRADDYTEHFHDLLRESVADRLRTNRVWVFMSGGIDSPTLAAAAHTALLQRGLDYDLEALTSVDDLVPEEREYAESTAASLGIPIRYHNWTEFIDPLWEQIPFSTPEPSPTAWLVPSEDSFWRELGDYSRVFFFGEGPDNALRLDWRPYVSYLVRGRHYGRLLSGVLSTLFAERRPPWWGRISRKLKAGFGPSGSGDREFPAWLNEDLRARLGLRERWDSLTGTQRSAHAIRPEGYTSLHNPMWQTLFEGFDSGSSKTLYEVRYPFVDLRMLRFLLAVPPLPWCRSKYLLRRAMRGRLPAEVLRRRKTGIPYNLRWMNVISRLCRGKFTPAPNFSEYVDMERLKKIFNRNVLAFGDNLSVRSLNHWLQHSIHRRSHQPGNVLREATRS